MSAQSEPEEAELVAEAPADDDVIATPQVGGDRAMDQARRPAAADELAAEAQELGIY